MKRVASDPAAVLRAVRAEAAAEIHRLIAFLDATEDDADLEPSIGAADRIVDQRQTWQLGSNHDDELDLADLEPEDDVEHPCQPGARIDQRSWPR